MFRGALVVATLVALATPADGLFLGPKIVKKCVVACAPKPKLCKPKVRCSL